MPAKKGAVAKSKSKKIMSRHSEESVGNDGMNQIDVQYNPELINQLLSDLKAQIDSKCRQIEKDCEFMSMSIKQTFHLELIKLPSQVQQMPLSRFKEQYGDSLEAMLGASLLSKPTSNSSKISSNNLSTSSRSSVYASAQKSKSNNSKVFQTPSNPQKGSNFVMETPSTVMRMAKEGETFYSANGSPIESTVVKPKANSKLLIPQTPGIQVPLETGEFVDIDNVDIDSMSQEVKQDALVKMHVMMSNIQAFMSKLQQNKE